VIVLGDLNFRIELPREEIFSLLNSSKWDPLIAKDQLKKNQADKKALEGFCEGPLKFKCSYKFNPRSDDYDTSEKARSPAWCDRILFKGGNLKCELYDVIWEVKSSDHKPVVAIIKE